MSSSPANWYPDPCGRADLRYWDGHAWTDDVSTEGRRGVDPVTATPSDRELRDPGDRGDVEGGGLFTEQVLIVHPNVQAIELNAQCRVDDQRGRQLAAVTQVESTKKKIVRLLGDVRQLVDLTLEVRDPDGRLSMRLTRLGRRSRLIVIVTDADGREIGRIVQTRAYGKIDFRLQAGGQTLASMRGKGWQPSTCRIHDATGTEIARFSTALDDGARTMFVDPSGYVVQMLQPLTEPLSILVVAAAISMGTALDHDWRLSL